MVFKRLIEWVRNWREQRLIKKRIEELKKRDPFIYK